MAPSLLTQRNDVNLCSIGIIASVNRKRMLPEFVQRTWNPHQIESHSDSELVNRLKP